MKYFLGLCVLLSVGCNSKVKPLKDGDCITKYNEPMKVTKIFDYGVELTSMVSGANVYRSFYVIREEYRRIDCVSHVYTDRQ